MVSFLRVFVPHPAITSCLQNSLPRPAAELVLIVHIKMDSFPRDYYDKRCRSGKKSGDIFNDYLDLLDGVACAEDDLNWQLNHNATAA
jgi:hypothetical protein